MTIEIDFSYAIDGFYHSVNYYRSETPMDPESMPVAVATGIAGLTYTDTTAIWGNRYYVRFGSVRSGIEKISDELTFYIKAKTSQTLLFTTSGTSPLAIIGESGRTFTSGTTPSAPAGWAKSKYAKSRKASDGSFYCEVKIDEILASTVVAIGVAIEGTAITTAVGGAENAGDGGRYQYFSDGRKRSGGVYSTYAASYSSNDVIGVLIKPISGNTIIGFYKNGVYLGDAFTITGLTTNLEPHFCVYLNSTSSKSIIRSPLDIYLPEFAAVW